MFKSIDLWLPAYLRRPRLRPSKGAPIHLLLAVCDHFEPFHDVDKAGALGRVAQWQRTFPAMASEFPDADGHLPKQTFFYPVEQYDADILSGITDLCQRSGCEVEVHLHHREDTPENFRASLEQGKRDFCRHGLLSEDPEGRVGYGFIHGNWALNNSHPEGRGCGVDNELPILRETGCYADFTMPSAPHPTQTRTINSLYYARETGTPKCHDQGRRAKVGSQPAEDEFLLVQGPLGLNWRWRKWGILPRLENGDLTGANPPTFKRLQVWRDLGIQVQGRPEWVFVKLHTHGAIERNSGMLLGEGMRSFHRDLAALARSDAGFKFHYVSAREMVNILHAAEEGQCGDPGQYRDYHYRSLIQRSLP